MILATSKFWKLFVLAARYSICWTILFNLGTIWVTGLGNYLNLYGKGLISQDSILLASSLITWPFLIEDSERHTNREIHSIHSLLVSPLIRWVPDPLLSPIYSLLVILVNRMTSSLTILIHSYLWVNGRFNNSKKPRPWPPPSSPEQPWKKTNHQVR